MGEDRIRHPSTVRTVAADGDRLLRGRLEPFGPLKLDHCRRSSIEYLWTSPLPWAAMRDPEKLTEELAAALVADQFPHWAELPVDLLLPGGHDNRTFRLGADLTVRLPTDDGYIAA